uniref:Uncharacterized protein n=1 Tax=viral metagenome TaxID=1070528 RepID=A0A6M3X892_9ZZZZ
MTKIQKLYRCPECGSVLTDEEYESQTGYGRLGYCMCKYTAYDENGDIWYPRELVDYEIFVREET